MDAFFAQKYRCVDKKRGKMQIKYGGVRFIGRASSVAEAKYPWFTEANTISTTSV
jgi:hypothetical protein